MPVAARANRVAAALAVLGLFAVATMGTNATAATPPVFTNYSLDLEGSGEPTIAVNWKTGKVLYQALERTVRITGWNDTTKKADWKEVTPFLNFTLDPILWTDHQTGRTFVAHLYLACSELSISDDDGESWIGNPMGCAPGSVFDHETVGGGPLPVAMRGILPAQAYQNVVYYCTHGLVVIGCGASLTGGLSFNPATPIRGCAGGHGHIRVAPDGTAYLPHGNCSNQQALITSSDAGVTWTKILIPDSEPSSEGDPAVGIGSAGSLYFGYQSPTGTGSVPMVATSRNKGSTWTASKNVGAALGIKNVQFPTMIAGDDNRAAFAFLGTTTGGDDQSPTFNGAWHLYVSTTYDGGATWTTVNATPNDPVQRGRICMGGIGCNGGRNLLDFMGMDIDKKGVVHIAYADGCVGCTSPADSYRALAKVAKQTGGTDLIAAT